jgi:hypothetical protein
MALVQAGKVILSVSKGVATWRKGAKKPKKEESRNQKVEGPTPPVNTAAESSKELK